MRRSPRWNAENDRKALEATHRRNRFAELIAADLGSLAETSRVMGIPARAGQKLFARIREELGWQAV